MKPVKLSESARKKPLSYDPVTPDFLYLDDVKAGRDTPPQNLDNAAQHLLTLRRLEMEAPFSIESLETMDKERQMKEVRKGTQTGKDIIRAEIQYLSETIEEIRQGNII